MKPKHIFWGFLFISIGILILMNNLGSLTIDLNEYWKYWPLVLILIGASFLFNNVWLKSFFAAVSGIILAIALFSFFSATFTFIGSRFIINDNGVHVDFDNGDYDTARYSWPYETGVKKAEFNFKGGAGEFNIEDTTSKLFEAATKGLPDNYILSVSNSEDAATVNFKMKKKIVLNDNRGGNKADIKLNTTPVWDMNFKLGAAGVFFDLSPYKVNNIAMNMGAAKVKVKLGDKNDKTNFNIDAGVSSLTIEVPDSAGCQINEHVSLSSKNFKGFKRISSNEYRTSNFDKSSKKIYIKIKSGVSSVKVYRYSSGW